MSLLCLVLYSVGFSPTQTGSSNVFERLVTIGNSATIHNYSWNAIRICDTLWGDCIVCIFALLIKRDILTLLS